MTEDTAGRSAAENPWPPSDDGLSDSAKGVIASESEFHESQEQLEELRTAKQPTSDEEI